MNVHSSDRARNEHNPPHSKPDVFGGDLALGRVHSGRVGRRDRVREELADRSDEFEGRGQGKMVIGSTAGLGASSSLRKKPSPWVPSYPLRCALPVFSTSIIESVRKSYLSHRVHTETCSLLFNSVEGTHSPEHGEQHRRPSTQPRKLETNYLQREICNHDLHFSPRNWVQRHGLRF